MGKARSGAALCSFPPRVIFQLTEFGQNYYQDLRHCGTISSWAAKPIGSVTRVGSVGDSEFNQVLADFSRMGDETARVFAKHELADDASDIRRVALTDHP